MALEARRQGGTLVLTVDRPEARNAIDRALAEALAAAVEATREDPSVRAIVLASTGSEVFLAGGDLKAFARLDMGPAGAAEVAELGERLRIFEQVDVPVIAAVDGTVLGGGCEVLLLCDLVVMERQASLRLVHAQMGLAPAWGGTSRLCARVGLGRARQALLLAEPIDAETAHDWGLVDRLVEKGEALGAALAWAERVATLPRDGLRAVKTSLRAALAGGENGEREAFIGAWGGPAHQAAMQAFGRRRSGP